MIRLSTPVAGIVDEVFVDRGDQVEKGEIVARLNTDLEEIALEIARARAEDSSQIASLEARIAFLESRAERNEQLAETNAVSQAQAQEARLEAQVAQKELDLAHLEKRLAAMQVTEAAARLEQKVMRSPVDGVVMERLLNPGEYRDGEAHIATIAKLDRLRVEAFVPIDYYDRLALGQPVTIRPEPPLDSLYAAEITVIDRIFDAATATVGVRMEIANEELALPAGLRCDVIFDGAMAAAGKD
ncbi:efflux RND transporter periplasmic adaptor subunit [Pelagibaca abyssi]|nr:efflux RND transporter periplasmic adaptor subunit [Salipiger abyssi]